MLASQTAEEPAWQPQRLRVPREDETLFARPPLQAAVDLARENHTFLEHNRTNLQGRTLEHLRRWSRDAVSAAARDYTSALVEEAIPEQAFDLLFVAGHQPALFHPGVWVKNFAIGELASRTGGLALNLVVDNDTFSTTRIRVPQGNREAPEFGTIGIDEDRPTGPWEEAYILDRNVFDSFGERVTQAMSDWGIVPLARDVWPDAVAHADRSGLLADCLTAARHRVERRWGVANLELPLSRLCRLDPFLWFASHLLAHLPRFQEIHNDVLRQYRQVNKVRSRTHPVPELSTRDGWFEAPFWMWRAGELKRHRLFAREVGREVWLSDGDDCFAKLPLHPEMDACCAVEVLKTLPDRGIRLRTRALTTTLFARLCLSDLFVHGIGGAKYDEMTDRIIARFFRLPPPAFLTLSATLNVPLAEPYNVTRLDEARLVSLLRDLEFNPDRHLSTDADAAVRALVAEKKTLLDEQHAAAEARGLSHRHRQRRRRANYERYHRLREINRGLVEFVSKQRRRVEEELATVRRQLAANAVLQDREYSFCLYPEEKLRPFLTGLWTR